jgi:hypothetical protein
MSDTSKLCNALFRTGSLMRLSTSTPEHACVHVLQLALQPTMRRSRPAGATTAMRALEPRLDAAVDL